jgi:phospholipid/cholesterol/gamma-HCH transport system substrate-binding protein
MVISALLLAAILIVVFGDFPTPFRRGKELEIRFASAPGVMEGTPVRKSGILVGRVEEIGFSEDSADVIVKVRLDDDVDLRKHEFCRIDSGTLLGDAVLEFVPGDQPTTEVIEDGATLQGVTSTNPLEMITELKGDLRGTLTSVASASEEITKLAKEANQVMGDRDEQQLQRIVDKTEIALDRFVETMDTVTDLLDDEERIKRLQDSIDQLPAMIQQTRDAMASIRRVGDTAQQNLENLEGLTGPLGERGAVIADRVDSSLAQFDEAMTQLVAFTEKMNRDEGTLGQLLNNPELYHNVNSAVLDIRRLTTDLRPILNDVRVFTDKIARDPGQLGVRGALQRNNNRTKYPNFKFTDPPRYSCEDLRPPADWREEPAPVVNWHHDPRPAAAWREVPR